VRTLGVVAMVALLVLVALVVGPGDVALADALAIVGAGGEGHWGTTGALVWDLRLPRALLAAIVGAALGAAGTVTQGLFRNPMAEPSVLGVSLGAALAAVIGFVLGVDEIGPWVTPVLAAVGAAVALAILFAYSRVAVRLDALLLGGIALGALFSALTTLALAIGSERWDIGFKVVRWLMGSFEGRSWMHLGAATPAVAVGLAAALWLRLDLDALQLGDDVASSLGVAVDRARIVALVAVALLVGAATATAGVLGFVGLVVPHVARSWIGPGHRALVPLAAALGAVLVVAVDIVVRTAPSTALPPGVVTSLLGAPFFLWLLARIDREERT
jgi:iron complex transport system permease protein